MIMAKKRIKMKSPDGTVLNVAEEFVSVFNNCGYTLVKEKKSSNNAGNNNTGVNANNGENTN